MFTGYFPQNRDAIANPAVLQFYDWDNTQIGALAVRRGVDVRSDVNRYILYNLIHPALRGNRNYGSLARADTYRGEEPCVSPSKGDVFADGEKYPLTNKLDYAFYRRAVASNGETGELEQAALFDADSPYIHGWKQFDPAGENIHTALDAGVLFKGFSFENITDDVVCLKAVYEPGEMLNFLDEGVGTWHRPYYTISYHGFDVVGTSHYVFNLSLTRKNICGYGVTALKQPAIRASISIRDKDVVCLPALIKQGNGELCVYEPELINAVAFTAIDYMEGGMNFTGSSAKSGELKLNAHIRDPESPTGGFTGDWVAERIDNASAIQVENLNTTGTIYPGWNAQIGAPLLKFLGVGDLFDAIKTQFPDLSNALVWNVAKNRIVMYKAGCGNRALRYQDIVSAIGMNTGSFLTQKITPVYLKHRVQSLMDAYTINGGDLTEAQMISILQFIQEHIGETPDRKMTPEEITPLLA